MTEEEYDKRYDELENALYKCKVTISSDIYLKLLEERRANIEKWFHWTVPDLLWLWFLEELVNEVPLNPDYTDPSYIVDNLAVNADCGDFDDYKRDPNQSDEDFIKEWENECVAIYPEERFIIINPGI